MRNGGIKGHILYIGLNIFQLVCEFLEKRLILIILYLGILRYFCVGLIEITQNKSIIII